MTGAGGSLGVRVLRARVEELELETLVLRDLLAQAVPSIDGPLHRRIRAVLDRPREDQRHG